MLHTQEFILQLTCVTTLDLKTWKRVSLHENMYNIIYAIIENALLLAIDLNAKMQMVHK